MTQALRSPAPRARIGSGRRAGACLRAGLAATALRAGVVMTAVVPAVQAQGLPSDREALVALGASVLKIEAVRQHGGYSLGSGVVVAPHHVVTNCHVTRDARSVHVLMGGQRYPVQSQAVDAHHDLCMLKAAAVDRAPVALGRASALAPGQRVTAIGYTGGLGLNATDGRVVALHPMGGAPVIQSTNWFTSGASGGGLFDDQQRLAGILTFRLRGGEAHYFAAPAEWIASLLEPGTVYHPVQPLAADALAFWQRPAADQPAFLQAEALTRSARWTELRDLSLRWLDDDFANPQAAYARGVAEEGLGRTQAAFDAYTATVARDRAHERGWLRLGLVSAGMGLNDQARRALQALRDLGSDLAAELASRLGPT